MGIVSGIWLIMLSFVGLLAGLHPSRRPDGAGWVLVVFVFLMAPISGLWGAWGLISAMLNVGWIATWPLFWVSSLMSSIFQFLVGILSTVRTIQCIAATAKPDLRKPLIGLSFLGVLLSVWQIVAAFLFM